MAKKEKHPGGRPSEYNPDYVAKADEYLKLHQDIPVDELRLKVNLPTLKGFAAFIDINESTLYEWDKTYPEFSKSLSKIKAEQHARLLNNGLAGTYNPTIAKLILSSNHGYKEKSDVTSDDKPMLQGVEIKIRK
jgi:hypothetical protein